MPNSAAASWANAPALGGCLHTDKEDVCWFCPCWHCVLELLLKIYFSSCICVPCVRRYLCRPEEDTASSPVAQGTDGWALPNVDAGNWIWDLWKASTSSNCWAIHLCYGMTYPEFLLFTRLGVTDSMAMIVMSGELVVTINNPMRRALLVLSFLSDFPCFSVFFCFYLVWDIHVAHAYFEVTILLLQHPQCLHNTSGLQVFPEDLL